MSEARLDILVAKKLDCSREYAKSLILSGHVLVQDKLCKKPGNMFSEDAAIDISQPETAYVSRGGYKLEKALTYFTIDVSGLTCMDIGASTGGFTDCLLQNSAARVYTVDNGSSQLAQKLAADSRVIATENRNINSLTKNELPMVDFICIDVSFVSVKKIIDKSAEFLKDYGNAVILIKPQFEAERAVRVKNDRKTHAAILRALYDGITGSGLGIRNLCKSPITGKDGSTEYLMHAVKSGDTLDMPAYAELIKTLLRG